MKKTLLFIVLLFFTNYSSANQNKQDEQAIKELIQNWIVGWQTQDTQLTVEGFASDADWMNAFGVKTERKEELVNFLNWVFSLPNARERKDRETITKIRFIKPDVALAYSDFEVEKRRYKTGEEMADCKGHLLRVLIKENDKWQIVSMVIMDEKARAPTTNEKGWKK